MFFINFTYSKQDIEKRKLFINFNVVFYMIVMISEKSFMKLIDEVTEIRKLVELLAKETIRKDLEDIATTVDRQRIWTHCDGSLNTEEIAQKVNVSQRSVQRFVKELREADLIKNERRGYPKRRFDYIPSDWHIEME